MKNLKLKKGIIVLATSFVLLTSINNKYELLENYEIIEKEDKTQPFAKYESGLIYICKTKEEIENVKNKLETGDVLVIDKRNSKDPNILIMDSYKIKSRNKRNSILKAILKYESLYPSEWDRTLISLKIEWEVHNISYLLNYEKTHSSSVDLNNLDEDKYSPNKILKKSCIE